jgi:hypothetical protein
LATTPPSRTALPNSGMLAIQPSMVSRRRVEQLCRTAQETHDNFDKRKYFLDYRYV